MTILWFDTVKSTNDIARQQSDNDQGYCIATKYQTKGRGQQGNVWQSNYGENILVSFIFNTPFTVENHFCSSMIASIAITSYLTSLGIESTIKWPNDIIVDSSKIAGILIENEILGVNVVRTIIGIGLNVNQMEFENLNNVTSIRLIKGYQFDIEETIYELQNIIVYLWNKYSANLNQLKKEYLKQMHALNGAYYAQQNNHFYATISNVDFDGRIHLISENKQERSFYFKQVKFLHL